jgi:hypothetical protein
MTFPMHLSSIHDGYGDCITFDDIDGNPVLQMFDGRKDDEAAKILSEVKEVVELLCSAHEIATRNGLETNWTAFITSVKAALVPFNRNGVTARTYRAKESNAACPAGEAPLRQPCSIPAENQP